MLLFIVAALTGFHQQRTRVPFSTSLRSLVSCRFGNSHPDRCEVIAHDGLDLHFPDD